MVFAKITRLGPATKGRGSFWKCGEISPSDSTRVPVEDLDGDGKLDLIVGDRCSLKVDPDGVIREEAERQMIASNQGQQGLLEQMRAVDNTESEKLRKKLNQHYQKRKKIMKEESTRFV